MTEETLSQIKDKLKNLPMSPGVYLMKNVDNEIIYVGKSKVLKNRVSSYFINSKQHTPKTITMVSQVNDFDYILTDSEVEALVLECNLIKKYRPKYNILLKDDKQYPYIKITNEAYPRIYMTRRVVKDGSRYYGPYMSSHNLKETLEVVKKIFKVRSCNKKLPRDIGKDRPCLYYHIGQCSAPCDNKISQEEYSELFEKIGDVLNGKYSDISKQLTEDMYAASEKLEFERAAHLRDKIEHLNILNEKQKVLLTDDNNRDIIGICQENKDICVQIFYMRGGKVIGSEYYVFENTENTPSELLSEFVKQFYFTSTNIPKEILLALPVEDMDEIELWLKDKTGYKVNIIVPQRGEKAKIVKMVNNNAEESLHVYKFKRDKEQTEQNDILKTLSETLSLKRPPFRIESYDISNISGAESLGVCIVYKNAKPLKSAYRRFNIKTVVGANDYESMREVIYRRICRAYKEEDAIKNGQLDEKKAKFLPLPDLILLDGGKGHVSTIKELFDTMGEEIPVFGLVKDDKHHTRGLTDESSEYDIDPDSALFKFLTSMQDEVHRFAITAFRKRHENAGFKSELDNIEGIGKSRRLKLMTYFMSIENIKNASYEELCKVVDKRSAKNIIEYFKNNGDKT